MQIQPNPIVAPTTSFSLAPRAGGAININMTLTDSDQKLLTATYGGNWQTQRGSNGDLQTNPLADIIAISRANGSLTGAVTEKFLAPYASGATIPSEIIQKALTYLSMNNQQLSPSKLVDMSI